MMKGINKKSFFLIGFIAIIFVSFFIFITHLNNISFMQLWEYTNLFGPSINTMAKSSEAKHILIRFLNISIEGWKVAFNRHSGFSLFPVLKEMLYVGLFGFLISIFTLIRRKKFEIWQCFGLFTILIISSIIYSHFMSDLPTHTWTFQTRRTYSLIPIFIFFAVYILNCFKKQKIIYFCLVLFLLVFTFSKDIVSDVGYTKSMPETNEPEELVSAVQYLRKNLKPDDIILAPENHYFSWRTGLRCFNLSVSFNYAQLLERANSTHSKYLVIWSVNDSTSDYKFLYNNDYAQNAPELKLLKEFKKDKTDPVTRIFKFGSSPD